MTVKIGVCGAAGRMGKALLRMANDMDDVEVGGAVEHEDSPLIGTDIGEYSGAARPGIKIVSTISSIANQVDVMIDFTVAGALPDNLEQCRLASIPMVIGTTGLSISQRQLVKQAALNIPIVFAPNMSVGVNLCLKLLEITTQVLGANADIDIIEAHHRHKKDAPSGTALCMKQVIADTLNSGPQDDNIHFNVIRAGDIIGEHTVMFTAHGERIEISHKASSRDNFASGAIKAAVWLKGKKNGLFDMQDVLF